MPKEHKKLYKAGKNWIVATLTATTITLLGGIGAYTAHADTTAENNQSTETSNISQASQSDNSGNLIVLSQPAPAQSNQTTENNQSVQESQINQGGNQSTSTTPTTETAFAATNSSDGLDPNIYGTVNVKDWDYQDSNNIINLTGYHGQDTRHISVPNLNDFDNAGVKIGNATGVGISSKLASSLASQSIAFAISKTSGKYSDKVTATDQNWSYVFSSIAGLINVDVSNLDTRNITNMSGLFSSSSELKTVGDLSQWNTSNVTDMSGMFAFYNGVIGDLSHWNVSNVRDMSFMFGQSSASVSGLTKWNIRQTTDMSDMFLDSSLPYEIVTSNEDSIVPNQVTLKDNTGKVLAIIDTPTIYNSNKSVRLTIDGIVQAEIDKLNKLNHTSYGTPKMVSDGDDDYSIANAIYVVNNESQATSATSATYKTITRTICIHDIDGNVSTIQQAVVYTRYAISDTQGNIVSYTNWVADGNSYWDEYIIPQHAGYKSQCNLQDTRIIPRQYVNSNDQSTILSVSYVKSNNNSGIDNNININDHGNYAFLDNESIDTNGQLNVSGWHATNASYGRPYHYIILLDHSSGTEIKRINITNQELQREDVANVHPVYGANHSGFNVRFNLASILPNLSQVQVVSRYTNDPSGNGDSVDYWFNPISIDRSNRACMDNVTINNNQLVVSGWHATNLSANKPYHVLIAFDRTLNHEIARVNVKQINRPDVANIYPDIYGADKSGFLATFNLHPEFTTDSIQFVSRYSSDPDCNSDYIDYWFNPQRLINDSSNNACLDNVSIQGDSLHISGWHATNQAAGRPYHYIIAWDQNLGHEIARQRVTAVSRPDVANAYSTVANAVNSGFSVNFNLTPQFFNDNIQFISRWTDDAAGNGNAVDYWFKPMNRTNRANLDSVTLSNGQVKVAGWHATDLSQLEPNHYLIVFDNTTGQQVASEKVDLQSSQDVKNVFGDIQTADHSRFNYTFNSLHLIPGHNYSLVSRYSADATGNGNNGAHTDSWLNMGTFQQSAYSIDNVVQNDRHLTVKGWLANDYAMTKPYAYAILIQNGQEIGRQRLNLSERDDVAKAYPQIYRSQYSGFNTSFDLPTASTNGLQLVLRFTDDPAGNGNSSDKWINL